MASVNRVILLGNCGKDPEIRYAASGQAICNVSVATSTKRKNKDTGETTEDTQWHRVTFYDRLAEIAGEYVKKGNPIYVEGKIKYGKYTNKDGIEKDTVDIVATELQLLGGREGQQAQRPAQQPAQQQRPNRPQQPAPQQRPAQRQQSAPQQDGFSDMDDDIPFATNSMSYDMTTSKSRKMAKYDY